MFFRTDSPRHTKRHQRRIHRRLFESRSLSCEPLEARQLLATFQPMGPAAIINGQVEKIAPNNEVSGAIHTVLTHPGNANIMYAGSVNGGVWRTTNALSNKIRWQPMTDDLPSLSIGAMAMDPNNPSRIVAGSGRYSSFAESGGLAGLILTEDAGVNWTVLDDPLLVDKNISGVAIDGDLIIASAGGGSHINDPEPDTGMFRSTNGGQIWENIELFTRDSDFPDDPINFEVFDLVADPTDSERFYAGVADTGIFRTDDGGATWTDASSGAARISQLFSMISENGFDNNNIEMAVSANGRVYMTVITNGQPLFLAYSDSQGSSWTEMDVPQTREVTGVVGVSPRAKAGGQGNIHFSIAADPNDPYTVYVGGDRQAGDFSFQTGNSIGARDGTGKLFRGDTRFDSVGNVVDPTGFTLAFNDYSPQWEHLTHSNLVPEMPEGGTRRGSAPHADSREIVFDAAGNLIEGNDGGIYRRSSPRTNQGDWFSINGNLQVTEIHDIAYDAKSNILIAGNQDTGTVQQQTPSSLTWEQVPVWDQDIVAQVLRAAVGDGGDVAVDDQSSKTHSYRYTSFQNFNRFRRQKYDANNNLVEETTLAPNIIGNFVTPVVLNSIDARRMVVGGAFGIFESFDRGDSFREVPGPAGASIGVLGLDQTAMKVGGSRNGIENRALIYIGSGSEVFLRTSQDENLKLTQAQFPGGRIRDLTIDASNWANAYVVDRDDVYVTSNAGESWRQVTGNLHVRGGGEVRSIEFVRRGNGTGYVVVGTNTGMYVTSDASPGNWAEVGNLPNAPIFEMEYDNTDNVLAVGTLGRGAFLLRDAYNQVRDSASASSTANLASASGLIWNDANDNGVRDDSEKGFADVVIYVDINDDNLPGITEPSAVSNANGVYSIANIPTGSYAIRTALQPGYVQTFPNGTGEHMHNFRDARSATNLNFGVREGLGDDQGFDFGDAPAPYPTTLAQNGASHGIVPDFHMGNSVDGDQNGRATPFAGGDDNIGDDEDGVALITDIVPNSQATVEITISNGQQSPGILQGWIDFDSNGVWSSEEQIFKDLAVLEGVNTLNFDVPVHAVEGSTFARFRYGYERGISVTGRAVAGEVEDYRFQIVRGGPEAIHDSYTVRRNSVDNSLPVLLNDQIRPNAETQIDSVTQGTNGGSVRVASTALLYTPAVDFDGTDTFTYTLGDRTGLTDTTTVSVFVQPDYARIRLGATDLAGTPVNSATVGREFVLNGYVSDVTDLGSGVFAAYLDVQYPNSVTAITSPLRYGDDFTNGQTGSIAIPGLIDEVGGFGNLDPIGSEEALLFSVNMRADAAGTFSFTPEPADILPQHNVLLYDRDEPVPVTQIEFRGIDLTFVDSRSSLGTNPTNALDVNDDTSVTPLDALLVINQLNASALGAASATAEGESKNLYLDVSGDGSLSPLDALLVINALNSQSRVAAATPITSQPSNAAIAAATDKAWEDNSGSEHEHRVLDPVLDLLSDDLVRGRNV